MYKIAVVLIALLGLSALALAQNPKADKITHLPLWVLFFFLSSHRLLSPFVYFLLFHCIEKNLVWWFREMTFREKIPSFHVTSASILSPVKLFLSLFFFLLSPFSIINFRFHSFSKVHPFSFAESLFFFTLKQQGRLRSRFLSMSYFVYFVPSDLKDNNLTRVKWNLAQIWSKP